MLRCLFIGLGSIGQRHLRNLKALLADKVEVLAYRVRGERDVLDETQHVVPGEDVVDKFEVRVFDVLEDALAEKPDIVFVTNPTSLHISVATKAAQRGCHLFIEKPLSHELAGVRTLIQLADRNQCVACVAYQLRRHPAFQLLRGWVRGGLFGNILSARAEVGEYLPAFHPHEPYQRMYASRRDLGGGVVLSQIHELDLFFALFGLPRRVFSIGGKLSALDIDVEDTASSLLEYERDDGKCWPVHILQDFIQRPPRRLFQVVGEDGKVDWDLRAATLVLYGRDGDVLESHEFGGLPRNALFEDELRRFLAAVDGKGQVDCSLREGAGSLLMATAILDSQASGQPVVIDASLVA